MSHMKKLLVLLFLILLPIFLISGLTFYFSGMRKFGTPEEFKKNHINPDSTKSQSDVHSMNTSSDSIMLSSHGKVEHDVMENVKSESSGDMVVSHDSLNQLSAEIHEKQNTDMQDKNRFIKAQNYVPETNINDLAKLYDNMKVQQSAPLIIAMNETLAVSIILKMKDRNAAKLLGFAAELNIDKAKRINDLLAIMEK
jgi:flagellar motility protein MotE (MotC chaperone)